MFIFFNGYLSLQVKRAIYNAREAYTSWSDTTATERSNLLRRAAKLLMKKKDSLALLETLDTGMKLILIIKSTLSKFSMR